MQNQEVDTAGYWGLGVDWTWEVSTAFTNTVMCSVHYQNQDLLHSLHPYARYRLGMVELQLKKYHAKVDP